MNINQEEHVKYIHEKCGKGRNDKERRHLNNWIRWYEETQRERTKTYVTRKRRQRESGKMIE